MKVDNMKNAVTFTFFSFLLLAIATFLVFYRYDLYNADTTTFIRIGYILGDAHNGTGNNKDVKPLMQTPHTQDKDENPCKTNTQKYATPREEPQKPSARNTQMYDKVLAILATRSLHPVDTDGRVPSLGIEITSKNPLIEDPIVQAISKLAKSTEPHVAPERKSDPPITQSTVQGSLDKKTFIDPEVIIVDGSHSIPPRRTLNTTPSTSRPEIPEEKVPVVSYPAERLPTPVSSSSPPRSWPSLFLPDSGFADSAEMSPFSLFSRIADLLDSNEDTGTDIWPKGDDFTNIFSSNKRLWRGFSSDNLDTEYIGDDYGDYDGLLI